MINLRTLLGRAPGPGSAHEEGVGHWRMQRITAVALVPLTVWFVASLLVVARADYEAVVHWIGRPLNTVLLVVLLVCTFYHAILGLQVVIEDYVHVEGAKRKSLLATKLLLTVLGAIAIFAVLRIAFGGSHG